MFIKHLVYAWNSSNKFDMFWLYNHICEDNKYQPTKKKKKENERFPYFHLSVTNQEPLLKML